VVALQVGDEVMVKRVRWVADAHGRMGRGMPVRNAVYVLGDASRISWDSRQFGPVPEEAILGRVIALFETSPSPAANVAKAESRRG
jgi:type IV secretory pathway protease TraF